MNPIDAIRDAILRAVPGVPYRMDAIIARMAALEATAEEVGINHDQVIAAAKRAAKA